MRIAAVLGVKDEVEMIASTIDHLRSIGVDQIVITDYGSTDGTLDILAQAKCRSVIVTTLDCQTPFDVWAAREIALARESQADWVLFLDADEFWIPATGSLRDCEALDHSDIIAVDRFNIPVTPEGIILPVGMTPRDYRELLLFVRRVPDLHQFMMENPMAPWIRGVPGPKIMARPESISWVALAHHRAEGVPGKSARKAKAEDLIIAHAPFTTLERFKRKVASIEHEMVRNPQFFEGGLSWHWKRWVEIANRGALEEEYHRQIHDRDTLDALRTIGDVRSAQQIFENRRVPPAQL